MKIVRLPQVPNPDDQQYTGNPILYQRAIYKWAVDMKGKVEQASLVNDTPVNQAFVLGSYTLTTSLAGTSTGTAVSNFVLSIVNAFMTKGILQQNKGG